MEFAKSVQWQADTVSSPHIKQAIPVVVARNIPYTTNAHRFQNLTIYLPKTEENEKLVGSPVQSLPGLGSSSDLPTYNVYIHGGAWRDPQLSSVSVEADVAHGFETGSSKINGIVGINYTLSPYPTHPTLPYDPIRDNHSDPAREASHPMHVRDALSAFALLRSLGLKDDTFILSGHSCGACISLQSVLESPQHWGLEKFQDPPRPAAYIGLNGLYDLTTLVTGLGKSHENLSDEYHMFQGIAFGWDMTLWPNYSPARLDIERLTKRVKDGRAPKLVVLHQSTEDQLVPMNQRETLMDHLQKVDGMKVVKGNRCFGVHAAPWQEGYMIRQAVADVLEMLEAQRN